ncbi:hypothetical protein BC629DRAFT_1598050 [Irpex lacteus]|nr:hypothetical protein BC629DRAFT_1598050 [Irpex lacteus]
MTTHDRSGMRRFLTDELQDAEDMGERVWIMGYVLSGWDGTNALGNPMDLCEHLHSTLRFLYRNGILMQLVRFGVVYQIDVDNRVVVPAAFDDVVAHLLWKSV